MRKTLQDLNLMDDFLFFTMLNNETVGEEFGRYLLEIIFDRKFGKLKVVPQKAYYGTDTNKHGVRLDVYLEEEIDNESLLESATICDIEVESGTKVTDRKNLAKRARFYHSTIDVKSLRSGQDYKELKKVIVVMIMPFDPFGCDHMIYTIRNTCLEVPELPYDDGARTLFLYTRGKKGNPSEGLKELLQYMEDTQEENVKNESLRVIHNMVNIVKQNKVVSLEYMKMYEKERRIRDLTRAEEIVHLSREFGKSEEEIIRILMERLAVSRERAIEFYQDADIEE